MQFVEALEVRVKIEIEDKDTIELLGDTASSLVGIGGYVFSIVDGDYVKHYYTDFVSIGEDLSPGMSFVRVAIPVVNHRCSGGFVDTCGC